MSLESYLTKKLRKFSIVDIACIKMVYFIVGVLIFMYYPLLKMFNWWFYLSFAIIAAMPLYINYFSQKGGIIEKSKGYLKTNTPAKQVLLFIAIVNFSFMMAGFFPILLSLKLWQYLVAILVLAIKPSTKTLFW